MSIMPHNSSCGEWFLCSVLSVGSSRWCLGAGALQGEEEEEEEGEDEAVYFSISYHIFLH